MHHFLLSPKTERKRKAGTLEPWNLLLGCKAELILVTNSSITADETFLGCRLPTYSSITTVRGNNVGFKKQDNPQQYYCVTNVFGVYFHKQPGWGNLRHVECVFWYLRRALLQRLKDCWRVGWQPTPVFLFFLPAVRGKTEGFEQTGQSQLEAC